MASRECPQARPAPAPPAYRPLRADGRQVPPGKGGGKRPLYGSGVAFQKDLGSSVDPDIWRTRLFFRCEKTSRLLPATREPTKVRFVPDRVDRLERPVQVSTTGMHTRGQAEALCQEPESSVAF